MRGSPRAQSAIARQKTLSFGERYSASISRVCSVSPEMRTPTIRLSRSLNLCTTSGITRTFPFARTLYSIPSEARAHAEGAMHSRLRCAALPWKAAGSGR